MCVCVEGVWKECIGKDKYLTPLGLGAQRPSFLYPRKKGAATARPLADPVQGCRRTEGGAARPAWWPGDPWENAPPGVWLASAWWCGGGASKWKEPTPYPGFRRYFGASSVHLLILRTASCQKDDAGNTTGTGSIGYRVTWCIKSPLHQKCSAVKRDGTRNLELGPLIVLGLNLTSCNSRCILMF